MTHFKDGHWYCSKLALQAIGGAALAGRPHETPDGCAVLVFDARGIVRQPMPDGSVKVGRQPPAFVVQADTGHDLLRLTTVGGQPAIARVEFAAGDLADIAPLVEYDHLPEARKDYAVYPRGMRLA